MGQDLAKAYPEARETFAEADAILGFSISDLCFSGPKEALNDTVNTQPAVFATSVAVLRVLRALENGPEPDMMAGHSLGELTALTAAGSMSFADGLQLVRERGRLMRLAGERSPGGMVAVLKMEDAEVERACREATEDTGKPAQIANFNSPGQVVISGDSEALDRAVAILKERGGRRIIPLAVSIAAHSPLMATAVEEYRRAVDAVAFRVPQIPVVANVSARSLSTVDEIRTELAAQLTWPVRWTASVESMVEHGIRRFLEIGPRDVLSKLVKRIAPHVESYSVSDVASLEGLSLA
jgi:[acyl-carrier-protein] S-malonyltransferase